MKTNWTPEIVGYCPQPFEKVNDNTYIQRINITKNEDENDTVQYSCKSRFISEDIYQELNDTLNTPAQEKNNSAIEELIENQLILMSAIAELYETI